MKYYFLGGIWLPNEEKKIIHESRGAVQIAANEFQKNIIEGIEQNINAPVTILNELFIGAYPKRYKTIRIMNYSFKHNRKYNHIDYNIGFLNLPIIKHLSRYHSSKKYIRKCALNSNEDKCFIGYSMSFSIVYGLLYAKRINKKIKTCLIIPDLPEYMDLSEKKRGVIYKVIRYICTELLYKRIKSIDSFVTLTKYIYTRLESDKPYVVVEGISSNRNIEISSEKINNEKSIVYTGSLSRKYGVCELVDSFMKIPGDDLRLIICGYGDAEEYIGKCSRKDNRIIFKGMVSNKEARFIQKGAYILVNPRSSKEEYTKYSFPSKTMEYMMSGRPVLMYRLAGIPDEYDEYLFYIDNGIEESLSKLLQLPADKLAERGRKGADFVMNNKNPYSQMKKMLKMCELL